MGYRAFRVARGLHTIHFGRLAVRLQPSSFARVNQQASTTAGKGHSYETLSRYCNAGGRASRLLSPIESPGAGHHDRHAGPGGVTADGLCHGDAGRRRAAVPAYWTRRHAFQPNQPTGRSNRNSEPFDDCGSRHWRREYAGLGKSLSTFTVSLGVVTAYYRILVGWFWHLIPVTAATR